MTRKIITLILFLAVCFYACEKNETASGPGGPATPSSAASFSAKVNGNTVQADTVLAGLHIDTSLGAPFRTFVISALCDTQIIVPGFGDTVNSTILAVGNYNGVMIYNCMSDSINDYLSAAQFAITSVDALNQKVSGTFSGIPVGNVTGDTIVVTDGVFSNVHYEVW